jgi:acetyl-CoA synthetase/medium-chain acyl-CoA synthetase
MAQGTIDDTGKGFRLEVPDTFNFAVDVLGRWARDPGRRAMLWTDERGAHRELTFREIDVRSTALAAGFLDLGVGRGDRVLVILPPVPEWWETFMALLKVGAVVVPGTSQLTGRDIRYRIELAEASAIVTDEARAEKVDEALGHQEITRVVTGARSGWHSYEGLIATSGSGFEPAPTRSDDPAILYFTSGTTGYPKMVLHTQASYPIGHRITGQFWLDLRPDDVHWNLSDTGWAKAAWSSLFGPWNMGSCVFVYRQYGKPDPAQILGQFAIHGITSFCGPPTIYRLLVQTDLAGYRYPVLRSCVAAGEPLNPEVIETWRRATGLTIRDGYGQTETAVLVANLPEAAVRPGSMGRPTPGYDVDVIGDEGEVLAAGKEGDIAVRVRPERPVGLFREYWKDPEATTRAFRGDWYLTGDRAFRDEDGYLWFVGRADDVIISSAYRIGPFEVESALVEHPAVVEAAVVGKPDPQRGQIVKAFVMLAPGYEPSPTLVRDLQEHVKRVTAPYKYPREIEFVGELPKTISGKIRRVELREREGDPGVPPPTPQSA